MQVINSEYLANFKVLYYQKDINGDVSINGDNYKNIYTFDQMHPYNNTLPTIHITGPVVVQKQREFIADTCPIITKSVLSSNEEDIEKLTLKGRDKYKELKSNKPLKDLTIEEQRVLKKAYNDKYREKKKLFKNEEEYGFNYE